MWASSRCSWLFKACCVAFQNKTKINLINWKNKTKTWMMGRRKKQRGSSPFNKMNQVVKIQNGCSLLWCVHRSWPILLCRMSEWSAECGTGNSNFLYIVNEKAFIVASAPTVILHSGLHACAVSPGVKNILPITTAKVPIVKFYHVRTGLEGDISLYNTLVGAPLASLPLPVQSPPSWWDTPSTVLSRLCTTHTSWLRTQPSTGGWRSFVTSWRFLPKWASFPLRLSARLSPHSASDGFLSPLPPPDVRHRRCVSWQPVVVRLHTHGALLPAAEEPSCYPCAPRGTEEQVLHTPF